MSLKNETEFSKEVVTLLKACGCYAVKIVAHKEGWMRRGVPDIIAINVNTGRFLGLESKTLHGKYDPHQLIQLKEILLSGGYACGLIWNVVRQEMKFDYMSLNEKKELVILHNTEYYKLSPGILKLLELSA